MRIFTLLLLTLAISLTSGCNDSDSGNTAPKEYRLFPADYFYSSYREDYTLSGDDQLGLPYDATYFIEAREETTLGSDAVVPAFEYLKFTNLFTTLSLTITTTNYFTTPPTAAEILGLTDPFTGLDTVTAITTTLPQTAKIGEEGEVGTYTDSSGNTTAYTWALEKGRKGRANLIFQARITESSGALKATVKKTFEIDTEGKRHYLYLTLFYKKNNFTVTLEGPRDS
jgi:hypothetical protein